MVPIRHLKVGRLGARTFRYDHEADQVYEVFPVLPTSFLIEQLILPQSFEHLKFMQDMRDDWRRYE